MGKLFFSQQLQRAGYVWVGDWKSWVKSWTDGENEYEVMFELGKSPNVWMVGVYKNRELLGDKVTVQSQIGNE